MAGGIKLAPLLTEMKVDIASFKSDMSKAAALGVSEADKISKQMSKTAKVGETLSKTGAALTKGLTVPLAGAAIATTKMAVDFESSFAKVSTLLDDTVVDFDNYKESLIAGSNETKVAVDEYSEAVYQAISAGVDQTKAVSFTTDAMKLAKGGFTSGASAVDIMTTAINGYNLKAEIIGIYDATNNEVAGYTTDMAEATKKMADSEEGSYEQIISAQMRFDEESGNIVLANGEVVGSMEEVTKATDGTRTGIVKINGTPYNIKVNKDGTISALNAVNTAADNAARARKITFSVGVNIGSSVNSALQNVKAGLAGSYFNGLDNVPYDGFRAVLHKGERVLTAEENKSYSSGRDLTDYGAIKKIVRSELSNIVIELNDREMGRAYSRYAAERR